MLLLDAHERSAATFFRAGALEGEPVIFPTDTIYGIGAPIDSLKANLKIYDIKNRRRDKPMPILISCISQLYSVCSAAVASDEKIVRWLTAVWPDSNTVILEAAPHLPELFKKNGAVAVRMVNLGWLAKAITAIGCPVTATSVNLSGDKPMVSASKIYDIFKDRVKYMLWGESGTVPSQIIDLKLNRVRD